MPRKRASDTAVLRGVFGHAVGKQKTPCRAGLYARISTHDQQTLPLQRRALRDYVTARPNSLRRLNQNSTWVLSMMTRTNRGSKTQCWPPRRRSNRCE